MLCALMNVLACRLRVLTGWQLLTWAFGDFEYVEDFTKREYNGKQLPVRVYTTKGLKEQGRFGLQNAHQVVDYFSEVSAIRAKSNGLHLLGETPTSIPYRRRSPRTYLVCGSWESSNHWALRWPPIPLVDTTTKTYFRNDRCTDLRRPQPIKP